MPPQKGSCQLCYCFSFNVILPQRRKAASALHLTLQTTVSKPIKRRGFAVLGIRDCLYYPIFLFITLRILRPLTAPLSGPRDAAAPSPVRLSMYFPGLAVGVSSPSWLILSDCFNYVSESSCICCLESRSDEHAVARPVRTCYSGSLDSAVCFCESNHSN